MIDPVNHTSIEPDDAEGTRPAGVPHGAPPRAGDGADADDLRDCEFPGVAASLVQQICRDEAGSIAAAAGLMARCIEAGGVVQAYGTGHSRSVAQEMSARAGGLIPVGMLSVKDVVMFGDVAPATILDPTYERVPGLARQIWDLAPIGPEDMFVITSNSGVNAAIVELAQIAKDAGHAVVAITSRRHTTQVPAPHGARLAELADVVIDSHAPLGDATVDLGEGVAVGSVSTLAGVLITQLLVEKCCRLLQAAGIDVPVFRSANVPGGDEHNAALTARYADRIRLVEP